MEGKYLEKGIEDSQPGRYHKRSPIHSRPLMQCVCTCAHTHTLPDTFLSRQPKMTPAKHDSTISRTTTTHLCPKVIIIYVHPATNQRQHHEVAVLQIYNLLVKSSLLVQAQSYLGVAPHHLIIYGLNNRYNCTSPNLCSLGLPSKQQGSQMVQGSGQTHGHFVHSGRCSAKSFLSTQVHCISFCS